MVIICWKPGCVGVDCEFDSVIARYCIDVVVEDVVVEVVVDVLVDEVLDVDVIDVEDPPPNPAVVPSSFALTVPTLA